MSATHATDSTTVTAPVLYLAFELGWTSWKLAFTIGAGRKPRLRSVAARDTATVLSEIRHRRSPVGNNPRRACYRAWPNGSLLVMHGPGECAVSSRSRSRMIRQVNAS